MSADLNAAEPQVLPEPPSTCSAEDQPKPKPAPQPTKSFRKDLRLPRKPDDPTRPKPQR